MSTNIHPNEIVGVVSIDNSSVGDRNDDFFLTLPEKALIRRVDTHDVKLKFVQTVGDFLNNAIISKKMIELVGDHSIFNQEGQLFLADICILGVNTSVPEIDFIYGCDQTVRCLRFLNTVSPGSVSSHIVDNLDKGAARFCGKFVAPHGRGGSINEAFSGKPLFYENPIPIFTGDKSLWSEHIAMFGGVSSLHVSNTVLLPKNKKQKDARATISGDSLIGFVVKSAFKNLIFSTPDKDFDTKGETRMRVTPGVLKAAKEYIGTHVRLTKEHMQVNPGEIVFSLQTSTFDDDFELLTSPDGKNNIFRSKNDPEVEYPLGKSIEIEMFVRMKLVSIVSTKDTTAMCLKYGNVIQNEVWLEEDVNVQTRTIRKGAEPFAGTRSGLAEKLKDNIVSRIKRTNDDTSVVVENDSSVPYSSSSSPSSSIPTSSSNLSDD